MSETLHQLIKSLDTTEKSYFKKFAHKSNRAKSESYYKLFDSIDKQNDYNEQQVLKKNTHLNTSKQLAAAKNYLYHLILNSLCDYHKKKSVRAQLHQQLEEIEILCNKRLYNQAKKIVLKAKKNASKYELFPYLMEFQEWEEKISRVYFDKYGILEYGELEFKEEYHTIKQWQNYRHHREIINNITVLQLKQALSKVTKEQEEVKQLIKGFLKEESNKALSNSSQSFRYYILNCLAQMEGDKKASYEARIAHLELLERETNFRKMKPLRYMSILVNLSASNDNNDALKYLKMLEKVETKTSQEALFKDTFLGCNWLLYYADTKKSAEYLEKIDSLGKQLKEYPKFKNTFYYDRFVYLMIYNFFVAKEYQIALKWVEYYQQNMNKNPSVQYNLGVKILSILSNYELGYDFFVNYVGDTAYRIISKQSAAYKVESTLILFLRRMVKLPKKSSKGDHFKKLKEDLEQIDLEADGLFNLMEWVDEKIMEYGS